jgi:hypothetical protein
MIKASNRNITSRRALLRGAPAVAAAALAGGTVATRSLSQKRRPCPAAATPRCLRSNPSSI